LKLDTEHERFTLDVSEAMLKDASGFKKDKWPSRADPTWESRVHEFYRAPNL